MHSYLLEFALCKRLGTLNTGASLRISGSSQQMRALSAVLKPLAIAPIAMKKNEGLMRLRQQTVIDAFSLDPAYGLCLQEQVMLNFAFLDE
jgi:hypothetical protein